MKNKEKKSLANDSVVGSFTRVWEDYLPTMYSSYFRVPTRHETVAERNESSIKYSFSKAGKKRGKKPRIARELFFNFLPA